MDQETRTVLVQLHTAVAALAKLTQMAVQSAHPTLNEGSIQRLLRPVEEALGEARQRLEAAAAA